MSQLQRVDFARISAEIYDLIQSAERPMLIYVGTSVDWDCAHAAFNKLIEGVKRVGAVMPDDLQLADCNPLERSNLRQLSEQIDRLEPSETLALEWDDIKWDENRMVVRSSKTEHHEGKGIRVVPLFSELRPTSIARGTKRHRKHDSSSLATVT